MKTREEIAAAVRDIWCEADGARAGDDWLEVADYVLSLLAEQREADAKLLEGLTWTQVYTGPQCAAAIRKGGTT